MKLNKILMFTLGGCGVLVPVVLSSCATNSTTTSNNYNSKEIPVPCAVDLYDSDNTKINFASTYPNVQYEIEDINQWFQKESNNGRNYLWDKSSYGGDNGTEKITTDYFLITNYISPCPISSNPLFKNNEEFYTWIRSDKINHTFNFYDIKKSNNKSESKVYKFTDFNWSFLSNPNCNVAISIITNNIVDTTTVHRTISVIRIDAWPKSGSQWLVNRNNNSGNYNNTKQMIINFVFADPNQNNK